MVVAQLVERFETGHLQILSTALNLHLKDKNKEKEAWICPLQKNCRSRRKNFPNTK